MNQHGPPIMTWRVTRTGLVISTSIASFIVTWSLAHGVPITQAILLAVIVVGQSALGAIVWERLCRTRDPHPIESLAAGFVLATTIGTLVDQLLVFWPSRFYFLRIIYVLIGLTATIHWIRYPHNDSSDSRRGWAYALPLSFLAVILGHGVAGGWLLAAIGFGVTSLILYTKRITCSTSAQLLMLNAVTVACNLAIYFFRPDFTLADWRLFRLFTGSDDQIYSEAASNSLVHFGPFDSIFSPNTHVPYHWFTSAWTGNLGHLIDADAFTATLHIATPIGLLFAGLLVWSITHFITRSDIAGVLAVIATFAMSSVPVPLRFIYLINTSNVVSHLWLLLSLLVLARLLASQIRWGIPLLMASSVVALLSKVPYGFVLFAGLGAALVVAILSRSWTFWQGSVSLSLLAVSAGIAFKIFLEPQPFQDRGFTFFVNSANFAIGSRLYPLVPIVMVCAIAFSRFPYYLIGLLNSRRTEWPIFAFLITATTVSLIRFIAAGASAENYFLSAGLLFAGIGIGVFWGLIEHELSKEQRIVLVFMGTTSGVVILGSSLTIPIDGNSAAFSILPAVIGLLGTLALLLFRRPRTVQSFVLVASTGLAAIMLGAGVGSYLRIVMFKTEIEPGSVVAQAEIESLTWIRKNTGFKDLLASNRNLCADLQDCGYDETRQVIAAFSDRQVLIEGPRFLNGARNYPTWARERITDSVEFASHPTIENLQKLRNYGVDWFYLDKTDPRAAISDSFGDLPVRFAFENADTAVIDLRNG